MQNVKYISGDNFQYLENERDSSMELVLVNMGKEVCKPYHAVSAYREEYIIHFIISGTGFFSAGGRTWTLTPGQMFLIYPNEPIVYCPDKNDPWIYAWIGFRGLRADSILKKCGFSHERLVLPAPPPEEYMGCFDEFFNHITPDYANSLYRESLLLKLLSILANHNTRMMLEVGQDQAQHQHTPEHGTGVH